MLGGLLDLPVLQFPGQAAASPFMMISCLSPLPPLLLRRNSDSFNLLSLGTFRRLKVVVCTDGSNYKGQCNGLDDQS